MSETVICVGAVVRRDIRVLLVRQAAGHSLAGQWTIPWGQLGRGESPSAAALRETLEEGGIVAQLDGLIGVQELPEPWLGMIGLIYRCSHRNGEPKPDNRETDKAQYFSNNDLDAMRDPIEPLSCWLVRRVLDDDYTLVSQNSSNPFAPSIGFV